MNSEDFEKEEVEEVIMNIANKNFEGIHKNITDPRLTVLYVQAYSRSKLT